MSNQYTTLLILEEQLLEQLSLLCIHKPVSFAVKQQLVVSIARRKEIGDLGGQCYVCDKKERETNLQFPGETLAQNLRYSASRTLFVGALPLPDLVTWHTHQPGLNVQDTAV